MSSSLVTWSRTRDVRCGQAAVTWLKVFCPHVRSKIVKLSRCWHTKVTLITKIKRKKWHKVLIKGQNIQTYCSNFLTLKDIYTHTHMMWLGGFPWASDGRPCQPCLTLRSSVQNQYFHSFIPQFTFTFKISAPHTTLAWPMHMHCFSKENLNLWSWHIALSQDETQKLFINQSAEWPISRISILRYQPTYLLNIYF